jgi:hypothetical protein
MHTSALLKVYGAASVRNDDALVQTILHVLASRPAFDLTASREADGSWKFRFEDANGLPVVEEAMMTERAAADLVSLSSCRDLNSVTYVCIPFAQWKMLYDKCRLDHASLRKACFPKGEQLSFFGYL